MESRHVTDRDSDLARQRLLEAEAQAQKARESRLAVDARLFETNPVAFAKLMEYRRYESHLFASYNCKFSCYLP